MDKKMKQLLNRLKPTQWYFIIFAPQWDLVVNACDTE